MKPVLALAALGAAFAAGSTQAQARGGRASYHLHTGAMVTAARHEPVGSVLRVTNPQNGRSVVVRVNDRGPFAPAGRVLDLSTGAFSSLYGGLGRGHGPVQYEVLSRGSLASRGGSARQRHKKRAPKRHKRKSRRSSRR